MYLVTVNKFDTSLAKGNILVDFTARTAPAPAPDTVPPVISFTSPHAGSTNSSQVYVNVSVTDESPTSSFIDWNRSLKAYWSMNSTNATGWTPDFTGYNSGLLGSGSAAEMPASVQGKFGSALEFDGNDDFIRVPDSDSLDGFNELQWNSHENIHQRHPGSKHETCATFAPEDFN